MDAYVSKPIRNQELLEVVERCMVSRAHYSHSEHSEDPQAPLLDEAALLAGVDGDKRLLVQLVGLFLRDYPGMLSRIQKAVAERDSGELAQAAHALKGAAGAFSTRGMYQAARTLGQMAKAGTLAGADIACDALEKEGERLAQSLGALRGGLRARKRSGRSSPWTV